MIGDRMIGIGGLGDMNALGSRINIPNDLSPGGEIVRPLIGYLGFGRGAIVVVAANLSAKGRRAFDEAHRVSRQRAVVVGSVRRKRFAVRREFGNGVAQIIGMGFSSSGLRGVVVQAAVN